jgi:ABC-type multidrug transport system fused ATPase/permease subunit
MKILNKLFFLLTPVERRKSYLLIFMILIMALLDMIGVASILPFMAVLTNPSLVNTSQHLNHIYEISKIFGIVNEKDFLFALGVLVFILLIISLSFKALTTYVQLRFVQMCEYSIGKRLVERYLNQPYSWFLNQNSADIGKTILSEVGQIIGAGIFPVMEIIARGMVSIAIIILLFLIDPKLATAVSISLFIFYGAIFNIVKKFLNKIGEERLKNNQLRFTSISEAFGATKEIKVGGLEDSYIKNFSKYAKTFALNQAYAQAISHLPRFVLEAVAFGGVLLIILYSMKISGNFNSALPLVSLYVFAGYRLMPAMQQIYRSFTQLAFSSATVDSVFKDFKNIKEITTLDNKKTLPFDKFIKLENIYYSYPNNSNLTLEDISLNIPAKSTIGFIGTTGSGKTTTIDIILGLLKAQRGIVKIDDEILTDKNLKSWQRLIGYIPQNIYLSDDTLAANIAFGSNSNSHDTDAIVRAAKIANLHEFVTNDLPLKYQTEVGERGVRLSGGQRQRVGIARAIYQNPKLLVMDEATSALDDTTEKMVMEAINNLNNSMTIIIVAHRLNTLKNCDIIFKLEKGRLVKHGKFNEIIDQKK